MTVRDELRQAGAPMTTPMPARPSFSRDRRDHRPAGAGRCPVRPGSGFLDELDERLERYQHF